MPKLNVTILDGSTKMLDGEPGLSVMEIIRDAGLGDLLAICGGNLSCGTCHIYVDPSWVETLPKMQADEDDLLEDSRFRKPESRLSCQLVFSDALDGLAVSIAPED